MPSSTLGIVFASIVAVSSQDLFLAASSTATCDDIPPDSTATCAQRLKWGGCERNYMKGYCCQTCFSCGGIDGCSNPTPSPTPSPAPSPTPSTAVRLKVDGSRLLEPSGSEIRLVGFNWEYDHVTDGDATLMKQTLPGANVARIVGVLWDNGGGSTDCMTDTAPYWNEACFEKLDAAVQQCVDAQVWVVLAAKGVDAAGQDYKTNPDYNVFHNQDKAQKMYTMWQHVAAHYASWDYIAAYEILSEPRDKDVSAQAVHDFYEGACTAVHSVDTATPCMVGSTPYYKLWTFNDDIIIAGDNNVIYTFDYFVPEAWNDHNHFTDIDTYPGTYACNLLYPGFTASSYGLCPNGAKADTAFDLAFHKTNFNRAVTLRDGHNVPVFLNQWDVIHGVNAQSDHGRYKFISDVAMTAKQLNIGWAWWNWRGSKDPVDGSSAFVWPSSTGGLGFDTDAIGAVKDWM